MQYYNLDANESEFFQRELEFIKSQTYDILYPELKATLLIPVSTEAGAGATTITYRQFDGVGIMKIIANYADDLPRADVKGKEFSSIVQTLGGSYGFNIQEVREAAMAGRPLNARRASTVARANEQKVNSIAWFGDADSGLLGMLDQPNVPAATVQTGATSGNVTWGGGSPKNPDEIIKDLCDVVDDVRELTQGIENPNTILIPIAQNSLISCTPRSTTSDTTIKQFFMNNRPGVEIVELVELKDVDPLPSGGGAPKDVMIAYDKSPDKLTLEIPSPFEQFPPQERGLEFIVPAMSRIGGVIVYYPLSINIVEGI